MTFPLLTTVLFLPLLGALIVLGLPREREQAVRLCAMIVMAATFVVSVALFMLFDSTRIFDPRNAAENVVQRCKMSIQPNACANARCRVRCQHASPSATATVDRQATARSDPSRKIVIHTRYVAPSQQGLCTADQAVYKRASERQASSTSSGALHTACSPAHSVCDDDGLCFRVFVLWLACSALRNNEPKAH